MTVKIILVLAAAAVITIVMTYVLRSRNYVAGSGVPQCAQQRDIHNAISKLSTDDWATSDQTRKALLQYSNESAQCRTEIINALIQAMDKPRLNFVADRPMYFLWSNGSALLGELKAVEALDLLIDHMDLNDGEFSASMSHQPAVLGLETMGNIALPRLKTALLQNSKRNIRLAAALCFFDIDGPDAKDTLKQALRSESDPCVRRFIELSFEPATDAVLRERLLVFKCASD